MSLDERALVAALAGWDVQEPPALPGRTNHLRTGILVPLWWEEGARPLALVTVRARSLRRHGGELAFPGGKPDPDDVDLRATALREAREELAIEAPRVLGRLSSMPLYTSDYRVEPWVARLTQRPEELVAEPSEVEQVLRLDLLEILAGEAIEGVPYVIEGQELLSPVFYPEGVFMFGATAHVFHELLAVLGQVLGVPLPPLVKGGRTWQEILGRR